jgi:pimeloyl-ACP methyl ester carboxylesterase
MDRPAVVDEWARQGASVEVGGHQLFTLRIGESAPRAAVLLHGFPGSSFDWSHVARQLGAHIPVVTFDLLGYGLSDKPDIAYSIFDETDFATELIVRAGVERCVLVAHDLGDTVAAELVARANEGRLPFEVERTILTNGSIFIDMAQLSAGQRVLLSLPDERMESGFGADGLGAGLAETFSKQHPPTDEDFEALVWLAVREDGDLLLPRLIRYIEERRANQDRFTAGFVDHPAPLTLLWGEQDPIAVLAMTARMKKMRPDTEVVTWPDLSHWPSLEDPDRVAAAVIDRLAL